MMRNPSSQQNISEVNQSQTAVSTNPQLQQEEPNEKKSAGYYAGTFFKYLFETVLFLGTTISSWVANPMRIPQDLGNVFNFLVGMVSKVTDWWNGVTGKQSEQKESKKKESVDEPEKLTADTLAPAAGPNQKPSSMAMMYGTIGKPMPGVNTVEKKEEQEVKNQLNKNFITPVAEVAQQENKVIDENLEEDVSVPRFIRR